MPIIYIHRSNIATEADTLLFLTTFVESYDQSFCQQISVDSLSKTFKLVVLFLRIFAVEATKRQLGSILHNSIQRKRNISGFYILFMLKQIRKKGLKSSTIDSNSHLLFFCSRKNCHLVSISSDS